MDERQIWNKSVHWIPYSISPVKAIMGILEGVSYLYYDACFHFIEWGFFFFFSIFLRPFLQDDFFVFLKNDHLIAKSQATDCWVGGEKQYMYFSFKLLFRVIVHMYF